MSEAKFQVGDRVRWARPCPEMIGISGVKIGDEGRVLRCSYYIVVIFDGTTYEYVLDARALDLVVESAARLELAIIYDGLGMRGQALLLELARRLEKGSNEHGDFERPLDWTREAFEEDLDGIVYRTARGMKL